MARFYSAVPFAVHSSYQTQLNPENITYKNINNHVIARREITNGDLLKLHVETFVDHRDMMSDGVTL